MPGDIVSFEAGDLISADGRIISAATLEIDEAALTGESLPSSKQVDAVARGRAARRPPRHGVHEHERHPRLGADGGHHDGHVDRGGPHLRDAPGRQGPGDAAHAPDQHADQPAAGHRRARRCSRRSRSATSSAASRSTPVRDGDRVRGVGDPDRPARGHHDDPVVRDADAGQGARDREAAALGRDAGLDVGDQLRQDGHAHAQPDDRGRDGDPRPALHDQRHGLRHRGHDRARRRRRRRAARRLPPAVRARGGRGGQGRRPDRRPDRGRAGRAGREGRRARRSPPARPTRGSRPSRSTRPTR